MSLSKHIQVHRLVFSCISTFIWWPFYIYIYMTVRHTCLLSSMSTFFYYRTSGCVWGVLIFSIELVRFARGFQDHPKSASRLNTVWAEGVHLCYGCFLANIPAVALVLVPSLPFDPPAPVFHQFLQFHLQFKCLVPDRLDWYLNTSWCFFLIDLKSFFVFSCVGHSVLPN